MKNALTISQVLSSISDDPNAWMLTAIIIGLVVVFTFPAASFHGSFEYGVAAQLQWPIVITSMLLGFWWIRRSGIRRKKLTLLAIYVAATLGTNVWALCSRIDHRFDFPISERLRRIPHGGTITPEDVIRENGLPSLDSVFRPSDSGVTPLIAHGLQAYDLLQARVIGYREVSRWKRHSTAYVFFDPDTGVFRGYTAGEETESP